MMDTIAMANKARQSDTSYKDPAGWWTMHDTDLRLFRDLAVQQERKRILDMLQELHRQEERHNYYGFIARMIEEMPPEKY